MTHNELLNEADMLKGNIARMMVTKDKVELSKMADVAMTRLENIYQERCKELDDEIKVGDVVNAEGYHKPVVVIAIRKPLISGDLEYKVMNYFGDTSWELKGSVSKTGRHFPQIEEVIRKLKGEEDD